MGVGASSMLLSAGRSLVPPPAGYFPAMESNQRSPGLRARTPRRGEIRSIPFPAKAENYIPLLCPSFSPPDPLRWAPAGPPRGGGGIGTGFASPLAVTRRFSLRPQYFGHWPLGRISPLQDLVVVALPSAVLMPPNDGTNLYMMALGLSRLGVVILDFRFAGLRDFLRKT